MFFKTITWLTCTLVLELTLPIFATQIFFHIKYIHVLSRPSACLKITPEIWFPAPLSMTCLDSLSKKVESVSKPRKPKWKVMPVSLHSRKHMKSDSGFTFQAVKNVYGIYFSVTFIYFSKYSVLTWNIGRRQPGVIWYPLKSHLWVSALSKWAARFIRFPCPE